MTDFLLLSNPYRFSVTFQDCGQTGTLLAGLLDAPQATFASKVDRGDDGSFTVERETDSGKNRHRARLELGNG
jgi:electron transfer flavoprotein alpha/beta subunit